MAYLAGGAANATDLYTQLVTFLTTSAGWTLSDSLATYDNILKSSGVGGKSNNVMRLQIDSAIPVVYKGVNHPMNAIEWIMMRGYHGWNDTTHVGTREFSQIGPWMYTNRADGTDIYFYQIGAPTPAANRWLRYCSIPGANQHLNCGRWNARSSFYIASNNGTSYWNEALNSTASNAWWNGNSNLHAWVYDPTTDKEFVYAWWGTPTRADLKGQTSVTIAGAPWAWGGGGYVVWDGADYIYGIRGGNTTDWARYQISTNSWTTMTPVLPAAKNSQYYMRGFFFLPATASTFGEDCLVYMPGTGSSSVYRFGITSALWTTHTMPYTSNQNSDITYDGHSTIYWGRGDDTSVYKADISSGWPLTTAWTQAFAGFALGGNGAVTINTADSVCAKIHAHATDGIGFWFIANADRVIVITNVKGYYYWSYFGKYTSAIKTATMLTTAGVSAGVAVSVPVDSSDTFAVGETVNVIDPSNGTWEQAYISRIPDSNHVVVSLNNAYTSGSILTADWPVVGTSDCLLGVHPVDASGYRSDYQTSFSRIRSLCDNTSVVGAGAANTRKQYQFFPLVMYQDQLRTEIKGELDGVYMTKGAALASEEEIIVDGKRYKFFPSVENKYVESKDFVVGPLE